MSRDWEAREPKKDTRPFNKTLPSMNNTLIYDMRRYMFSRGLNYEVAAENLWYPSDTAVDNKPRIVIPATSCIPGNVYFQARAMMAVPDELRYLSPFAPRGDAIIVCYPNSQYKALTKVVIAEGPMDALAAATIGCLGLGLMGMSPPLSALALAVKYTRGSDVYLIADRDAPQAMSIILRKLIEVGCKSPLHLVMPESKDFAESPNDLRYEMIGE